MTPTNPCLLGYTDVRYRVNLLDLVTRAELRNPAVQDRVIADAAGYVAQRYREIGYQASASVLRHNGHAIRRHGPILFPHYAPRDADRVLLVDPEWRCVRFHVPTLPPKRDLWHMAGALLTHDVTEDEVYRPLWLDLQTGEWLAFTNIPHDYTGMPRSMCHPYLGAAQSYDRPAPPNPDADEGRVEYLTLKTTGRHYADLHAATTY